MRCLRARFVLLATIASLLLPASVQAARIDATKGREYRITKEHGPWMIMVASFSQPHESSRRDGKTPKEAADELVFALRKKGIPAYAFQLNEVAESIQTTDRTGRNRTASLRARQENISVIAGNYETLDDRKGQQTLKYIKQLDLNSLNLDSWQKEARFRPTPGKPKPFSGAFLTLNPLLSPEEIAEKKRDPLLLKLNSGAEYSIIENPGKYTLVVATFKGLSMTQFANREAPDFQVSGSLDDAAERAWTVTKMLREGLFEKGSQQQGRTFEAYTFHDHYDSLVTIGSFETPDDPRIAQLYEIFKAKTRVAQNGRPFTTGESILIPGDPPETVVFDPSPRLIPVPQIRK
ncbi:hypothetical protein GC176_07115 [bacterium]|nr:hypothetical protein [bacterium]